MRIVCISVAISVALSGCAITPQLFAVKRQSMSDYEVCSAWVDAVQSRNKPFELVVQREANRRGYGGQDCIDRINREEGNAAALIGGLLLVGAVAATARSGGGGPVADWQWDWDYINGPSGFPIWVCRGVQTGQFADEVNCAGRLKNDGRWPGLGDPFAR